MCSFTAFTNLVRSYAAGVVNNVLFVFTQIMYDDELPATRNCRDDSDSDEECSSAALNNDVMESSEEEEEEEVEHGEPEKVKSRELEWDDSTLTF